MSQRVRNGLGLPAGLYRLSKGGPTIFVPNGITADGVESLVCANVVPVSGGRYDWIYCDAEKGVFVPKGDPRQSPFDFNDEAAAAIDDAMRYIFNAAQPAGDFPYRIGSSTTRANIVDDLATLEADFVLDSP